MQTVMPDLMRTSLETFVLEMTQSLDPLDALKITNTTMMLMQTVYVMGLQDGENKVTVRPLSQLAS